MADSISELDAELKALLEVSASLDTRRTIDKHFRVNQAEADKIDQLCGCRNQSRFFRRIILEYPGDDPGIILQPLVQETLRGLMRINASLQRLQNWLYVAQQNQPDMSWSEPAEAVVTIKAELIELRRRIQHFMVKGDYSDGDQQSLQK